ncbi:hypothetical protein JZO70_21790 [Enterococcus sp. 669A]|uniref:Uncharacterized protein n=1 Tax=Candidatus Enterococcus moelleringii TaxID=2815325 RepID=A0ABS3LGP9_9ENTE|nr:hypothetical protein [Enterococcus sp. 669A]MBO1308819.1 hypothetical protein [Enterococcus sp. 669A]
MGFNGWRQTVPSEKSKDFSEGQEVFFTHKKVMRSGEVAVLLVNSAIINLKDLPNEKAQNEKTVISYGKLTTN